MVDHQAALARRRSRPVLRRRILQSRLAGEPLKLSAARHRRLVSVRESVAAVPSKDSPATGNLARLLLAQGPVKRESEKSVDGLVDLQLHRPRVRGRGAK